MSKIIPILKSQEAIKIFEKLGFYIKRQRGSHIIMVNDEDCVHQPVIPMHRKDLTVATLRSIIRQAGLTPEEFNKLRKKKRK